MLVGVMQIELYMASSTSLKAKRAALSSLKQRIGNKFNVSVSEVDNQDKWQRATLGVSAVSTDRRVLQKTFDSLLALVDRDNDVEAVEYNIDMF